MGEVFSTVKEIISKGTDKGYEDVLKTMDTLQELADAKSKLFFANLVGTEKIKEYQIDKVQSLHIKTYVSTEDGSNVGEKVCIII